MLKTIDLANSAEQLTVLIHGDSGAGKTSFAASFPRPLFLSVEDEAGWETLRYLPASRLYEPTVKPIVWSLSEPRDFPQAYQQLQPMVQSKQVQTVVLDSLSFYSDMFYNAITVNQAEGKADGWKAYGLLNDHLRTIRIALHKLGCHVVWLAVTRQPDDASKVAGPNLKGQQAVMFPAGCKYVWYMQAIHQGAKRPVRYELRTRKHGNALARGRDGGRLPDPIINPTYHLIADHLANLADTEFEEKSEDEVAAEIQAEMDGVASDESAAIAAEAAPVIKAPAPTTSRPQGRVVTPIRRPTPGGR